MIIYPPINLDNYNINENIEDYYLILSQLVYYKRIDIAIDAFNENNKKLIIIGEGDELKVLKNKANSNIEFFVENNLKLGAFLFSFNFIQIIFLKLL